MELVVQVLQQPRRTTSAASVWLSTHMFLVRRGGIGGRMLPTISWKMELAMPTRTEDTELTYHLTLGSQMVARHLKYRERL